MKFTERARKVLSLAQEEAVRLNQNYIGTGHLLLGLLREDQGVAAAVLKRLEVDVDAARQAVELLLQQGDEATPGELGLTGRAKKAIELTVDESRRLNHHYIGAEHLLLGLLREGEGAAGKALRGLGVDLEQARSLTMQVIGQGGVHEVSQEEAFDRTRARLIGRQLHAAYQPYHITSEAPAKTPIGRRAATLAAENVETILGGVTVNTGGAFTLTLYQGMADDAPKVAVISNPPTGASFPFYCSLERGLAYTLTGALVHSHQRW